MSSWVTPFKVGLLVLVALGAFLVFRLALDTDAADSTQATTVYAYFDDASGIGPKSRVQTAGIPVGEVSGVRLEGTRARVELRIRRDIPLKTDAMLVKRSESILGDYLIDLVPGSPNAPPMPEGGEIATASGQRSPSLSGWFVGRNDLVIHPATTVSVRALARTNHVFRTVLEPVKAK